MKTPSAPAVPEPRFTIALDLGDSLHHACVLDERATIVRQTTLDNTPAALDAFFAPYPPARTRVVFEAGCHSPWIFRHLQAAGFAPLVANPRKLALISAHAFKHDRQDAETLARLRRSDPALLSPSCTAVSKPRPTCASCSPASHSSPCAPLWPATCAARSKASGGACPAATPAPCPNAPSRIGPR